jgi:hypothetical protein
MLQNSGVTDLPTLLKNLEELSQKAESSDDIDIQSIIKQMDAADKVMDVIDEKTDQLLLKMDSMLSELEKDQ